MIITDRTITVRKGVSKIDEPVVVYRGDYEIVLRFTIMNSKFKFMSGANMIESEKASYGQLVILTPYGGNIFSGITRCSEGAVAFVITQEMLDQIEEVGLYSFQIRLFDANRESRVSIPPVEFGIEIREPIASEDHDNSVNNAIVGYSIAKVVNPKEENIGPTFDANGGYNKTGWETGDRISQGKLNKIENALYTINQNEKNDVAALNKRVTSNFNVLDLTKADKNEVAEVQSQVNNLVLGAVGDGNNAEVVQARGYYSLLNNRLNVIEDVSINIGEIIEDSKIKIDGLWELNGLSASGIPVENINRGRTSEFVKFADDIYITVRKDEGSDYNYRIAWYKYDTQRNFIEWSNEWKSGWHITDSSYLYKFAVKRILYEEDQMVLENDLYRIEMFKPIKSDAFLINEIELTTEDWEHGGIIETGETTTDDGMIRTSVFLDNKKDLMIYNPLGLSVSIHYYDIENGNYVHKSYIGHKTINKAILYSLPSNDHQYIKVILRENVEPPTSDEYVNDYKRIQWVTSLRLFTTPLMDVINENQSERFYNAYPALFTPYRFKLQAHRGLSNEYPENTVLAFEEAGKTGRYVGMETDVQRTSDGVFVLMHDDTIDRTTNGTGIVSNYTYAELQELYIDGGYGWTTTYAEQLKIPTLIEYLKVCRKYELIPYIEIKTLDNQGLADLIALLDREGFKGRCVLTSFTWSYLEYIRTITDEYVLEYMIPTNVVDYETVLNQMKKYKNMVFRPSAYVITEALVSMFREQGILIEAYGLNVGDTETLTMLKELGIEGVTCNSYIFE